MPLPNGAGGYQLGSGNVNEPVLVPRAAPAAVTVTTTLTAAQLQTGLILGSPGTTAATYTLPTVADLENAYPSAYTGSTFDFSVMNVDGSSSGVITLAAGTGWTLVGLATVAATAGTSQMFRARKSGAGAWTLYRMG